ncbi:AAA family ATPase [Prauserella rugosa]|uniref:Putative ATPase n=1 Tax=Prauserella rugosa TaxID=43354 RepID=A0A660CEG1_9PSEU|nr:LuxR family transcriptional regulator [Prauserella rugosa]KMS86443.1 hypothetical protein ACZ91_36755 [Streptomyces regensis]TWH20287.1 putative ATPase [Prauserella rugosa]
MAPRDRRAQLDELARLLSACGEGTGGLSVVTGCLGSGKTDLVQRFADEAAGSGALTLYATAVWSEGSLPGGVLDQLFRGARLPPDLADRVARLLTSHAERREPSAPVRGVGAETRFLNDLASLLLELSRDRPVVVVVDDLQFADSLSQQFVLHLRRRLSSARILLVLGEWDLPYPLSPGLRAGGGAVTRIRLRRLNVEEITEQLAERWGTERGRQLAPAWHDVTGGNPALVEALLADAAADPPSVPPQPGEATTAAVLAALQHVGLVTRRIAQAMVILGEDGEPELIARLAEARVHQVRHAIELLGAAGITCGLRLRHPALAAVIADGMEATERAEWHRRAARELYRRGGEARDIARHLRALGGASAAELPWAVEVLRNAAEQDLRGDRITAGIASLELASALAGEHDRLDTTRELVRALMLTSPSASSAVVFPVRRELCDGARRGRDLLILLWLGLGTGDGELVDRVLTRCREIPEAFDPQTTAELRVLCRFHGVEAGVDLPAGCDDAGLPDDPWVEVAEALGGFWAGRIDVRSVDAAEHVLRSSRPGETPPEVGATALLVLLYADTDADTDAETGAETGADRDAGADVGPGGRGARAERWCRHVIDSAAGRGAVTWQAVFEVVRAHLALRRGAPAEAEALATSALTLLPAQSWGASVTYPVGVRLLAAAQLGDTERIEEALRIPVPEPVSVNAMSLFHLRARGHAQLAQGRVLAAVSDFRECGRQMEKWGADVPLVAAWRVDLAEASAALGRYDTARDLLIRQLEHPNTDRRTRDVALRMLAGLPEGDAVAGLPAGPAGLVPEAGVRAEGPKLRDAAACVCPLHGGHADEQEQAGPSLSESERRVVELAVAGRTNREISRELYITVSTVEQHLTRVYRKFGVAGRAQLADVLGPDVLGPDVLDRDAAAGDPAVRM